MDKDGFITFWEYRKDIDDTPAIGIGINWNAVKSQDCTVLQYFGEDAWKKIGIFWAPHWGNFTRTILADWLNKKRPDYKKFIDEETNVGKIDLYNTQGLIYPYFCAFADMSGKVGSLGDGCHRYIDCNYLIQNGKDMTKDIGKCRLDVLCATNLKLILSADDIPPTFST